MTDPQSLTFTVPGIPRAKPRPRRGRYGNFYTPKHKDGYEERVQMCFLEAREKLGKWSFGDKTRFHVELWPHAKKARENRPDGDNIVKLVLDCLGPKKKKGFVVRPGLAFADDKLVSHHIHDWELSGEDKLVVRIERRGEC